MTSHRSRCVFVGLVAFSTLLTASCTSDRELITSATTGSASGTAPGSTGRSEPRAPVGTFEFRAERRIDGQIASSGSGYVDFDAGDARFEADVPADQKEKWIHVDGSTYTSTMLRCGGQFIQSVSPDGPSGGSTVVTAGLWSDPIEFVRLGSFLRPSFRPGPDAGSVVATLKPAMEVDRSAPGSVRTLFESNMGIPVPVEMDLLADGTISGARVKFSQRGGDGKTREFAYSIEWQPASRTTVVAPPSESITTAVDC